MVIISIAAWLKKNGVSESDLDDIVVDASCNNALPAVNLAIDSAAQEGEIADAETSASNINNDGLDAQIAFLTQVYGGAAEAAAVISEALDIPSALAA